MKTMNNIEFTQLFTNIHSDFFFVQIGANDGKEYDPIHDLVKEKKWNGILFESGTFAYSQLLKTYRDHDNLKFINSAVSDFDGESTLYCGTTTPHFTLDFEKAKSMFDVEPREIKVMVKSPKTIIDEFNISTIDLLQIDTEGRDFTIIKEFLKYIKPKIIRFEFVNLNFENTTPSQAITYLSSFGYDSYLNEPEGDIISILK